MASPERFYALGFSSLERLGLVRPHRGVMAVAMVHVGKVRMAVGQRFMPVPMAVHGPRRVTRIVRMAMMRVVMVQMLVL